MVSHQPQKAKQLVASAQIMIATLSYFVFTVINIAPVTQRVNLSDTSHATFYCRATTSINTKWFINGAFFESKNYSLNAYLFSEVIEVQGENNIVHDMYLEVPATVQNNLTRIQCVIIGHRPLTSQPPAMLIVQGKYKSML